MPEPNNDIIVLPGGMRVVSEEAYLKHKNHCSDSFREIFRQLNSQNLAIYGDEKNNVQGMLEMVTEIHKFFYSSKVSFKLIRNIMIGIAFLSTLIFSLIKLANYLKIWK